MYCTIELQIPRKTPSLLVPADAIIFNRDGLQVAVIEDGTARIRKLAVTRDLGTQVEVAGGVKQGEQVIVNPSVSLVDGSRVRASRRARRAKNLGGGPPEILQRSGPLPARHVLFLQMAPAL